MKICKQCGEENQYIVKNFCQICYSKDWYKNHKAEHIKNVSEYRKDNAKVYSERGKKYRADNKLKIKIYYKNWYNRNKEQHIKNVAEDKELRKEKYIMQS